MLGALIAGVGAVRVQGWCQLTFERAKAVEREAAKLNQMQGRVIALEGAIEQLSAQQRKLSGKFYQERQKPIQIPETAIVEPAFCANFAQAQIEGPTSTPARCECAYCTMRRAQRDELRKQLVPKRVKREGEK